MVKPKIVTGMVTLCRHTDCAVLIHSTNLGKLRDSHKDVAVDYKVNVSSLLVILVNKLIYLEKI